MYQLATLTLSQGSLCAPYCDHVSRL